MRSDSWNRAWGCWLTCAMLHSRWFPLRLLHMFHIQLHFPKKQPGPLSGVSWAAAVAWPGLADASGSICEKIRVIQTGILQSLQLFSSVCHFSWTTAGGLEGHYKNANRDHWFPVLFRALSGRTPTSPTGTQTPPMPTPNLSWNMQKCLNRSVRGASRSRKFEVLKFINAFLAA